MKRLNLPTATLAGLAGLVGMAAAAGAAEVLVEAEAFDRTGGWVIDQQFMDVMGSPYLLAHGLGRPVKTAATQVEFPETGTYHLWVRTKDWVPEDEWSPGRFTVVVDGTPADAVFGMAKPEWHWQPGGTVRVKQKRVRIELVDMTGFEGRCDALYFTTHSSVRPPAEAGAEMDAWRRRLLGLPETPPSAGEFDVVVTGGGIAGTSAAVAAARLGSRVALVQDRPVLGGNASAEIRVHTGGDAGPNIVPEINAPYRAGAGAEPHPTLRFDRRRHAVVRAEKNIHLFLNTHVFRVQTQGDRITSADGKHIRTGKELRFAAPVFIDCTGDGWVGFWAGAEYRVGREARDRHNESIAPEKADRMTLGTSLMWGSRKTDHPVHFPELPWAQKIAKDMEATEGNWTWEYGHYLDTVEDAEEIRDYLLRAIYGAWSNAKNGSDQAKYANLELSHVPFVAGKRESRRLIGDYILTQGDIQACRQFPDGVAEGSWSIDLHYPKDYEKYPFRTYAEFNKVKPYPIPYRCLYSKNIDNLLMAGRCVSLTHVALGSVRVMNTGGQLGVAAGVAAYLCNKHKTTPRGVYKEHLDELLDILAGRGEYEGALAPSAEAARAAAMPVPEAGDVAAGVLTASSTRCTGGYPLTDVPDDLLGAACVTAARGDYHAPGAAYAFTVDRPATVFLAVHDRGSAGLPEGWTRTDRRIRWKTGSGKKVYTDTLWRMDVEKGRVEVPPHLGREGRTYGLPHLAIVVPKQGDTVTVTPVSPQG